VIIRDGRVDERLALEELQRRASLAYEAYRRQLLDNPDVIELPRAHLEGGHVRVAEQGGRVLGFAVVLPRSACLFVLDGLFVEPGHWRGGIGRALIADACAGVAARGGARLETVANPKAEGFYEKQGFRVFGTEATLFGPARRMVLEIKDFPLPPGQS
jgi:GNAT superfamily N-acetyltransferase